MLFLPDSPLFRFIKKIWVVAKRSRIVNVIYSFVEIVFVCFLDDYAKVPTSNIPDVARSFLFGFYLSFAWERKRAKKVVVDKANKKLRITSEFNEVIELAR